MADPNTINLFRFYDLPINYDIVQPPKVFEFGILGRPLYDYKWIFYFGIIAAFVAAAGSGSNDVANSFATTAGSRSLKMWQIVCVASVMEFAGAMLLGARTVDTVRSNIVSSALYTNHEDLLMFGMLCAIVFCGPWLFFASYMEVNVSTTHSLIGSIVGFALCTPAGVNAVDWNQIGLIVLSWFVSPLLAGIASSTIFGLTRKFILRHENSAERGLLFFPFITWGTLFLNSFFVMYNTGITQGKGLSRVNMNLGETVGAAFVVGVLGGLFVFLVLTPRLRRYIGSKTDEQLAEAMGYLDEYGLQAPAAMTKQVESYDGAADKDGAAGDSSIRSSVTTVPKESLLDRLFQQSYIHQSMHMDLKIAGIHNRAEKFPVRTEFAFGYLQILTACFASFAHGAGDVANYIGPLASINGVYQNGVGSVGRKSGVEDWLLVLGGCGLIFGLATYGHKVIAAFGVKTVRITPSRGYAVELAAALVIVTAAFLGIPISTSHSFVGAIVGVGLMEGKKDAVNWHIILKNLIWWLATLLIVIAGTAMLFSWATFAPSQYYPLSKNNCMRHYGVMQNSSNGDPTSFIVDATAGALIGLYGVPSTGQVFPIQ